MTQDVPHPKTSALYWTGFGMSVNKVMNGTTKKQQNTQGQERVDCLKINKRRKWERYLTQQKEITMTDTYNNERLARTKEENINIIKGKNPSRCGSIHYKHDHESKQRVVGTQENPPSNITKLQNIQRGRTNVGNSSNKIFTITYAKYSNVEFLHRKHNACTVGTPENLKTHRIYVGIRTNISSQPA
jgi:hypothetical protein